MTRRRALSLSARTTAPPQRPQLDPRRLLQDGAGGEALDLGQEGADAGAAVGAGQVEALKDGEEAGGPVFGGGICGGHGGDSLTDGL